MNENVLWGIGLSILVLYILVAGILIVLKTMIEDLDSYKTIVSYVNQNIESRLRKLENPKPKKKKIFKKQEEKTNE